MPRMRLVSMAAISALVSLSVLAGGAEPGSSDQQWIAQIGLGAGVAHFDASSHDVQLNSSLTNRYINSGTTNGSVEFNASMGVRAHVTPSVDMEMLADLYVLRLGSSGGTVKPWINASPDLDTLNYSYSIDPVLLGMVETKLIMHRPNYQPYVLAGAGLAYVRMQDYGETVPAGSSASPAAFTYANGSTENFVYTVGVGVQCHWQQSNWVEFGYQYINAGEAQLGSDGVQTTAERLHSAELQGHYLTVNFGFTV